jgi:hypothetical protein
LTEELMLSTYLRSTQVIVAPALLAMSLLLPTDAPRAQPMQPGEAFVTRFSGTTGTGAEGDELAIDTESPVGSIIDLRSPGQPPQGQHWIDEPQRQPLKAADVGQIFGVALDGENPPNIYVTATPAFGLHRTSDNAQWMPGMWGPGGPAAVYKLDRANGYRPTLFAQLGVAGRANTGASLGNIAFDRWNRQFFVSDLESGMIHRVRVDGADLGAYDHGTQGRGSFLDAEGGQPGGLPPIAFDPSSGARIDDCPTPFSTTPECWNLAASGRRVWGVGVSRNAKTGEVRLFYAVSSSPAYGNAGWDQLPEDEKRNSVWSVRLGPDGDFAGDVRREFLLPDFFQAPGDIARAGYSHPVSDITFPVCGTRAIMLVAERGGIRNLGLAEQNAFAEPHEARLLRYELDHEGVWRAVGRYDVGFRERQPEEGPPAMQANCAGGAAFGYGYDTANWTIARNQSDQFVWTTGDALCSSLGPCNATGIGEARQTAPGVQTNSPQPASDTEGLQQAGDVEVHGIQGIAEIAFQQLVPASAYGAPSGDPIRGAAPQDSAPGGTTPAPQGGAAALPQGQPAQGSSLNEAYMIDVDVNVDVSGNVDEQNTLSNDATMIGDIAIYQLCESPSIGIFVAAMPTPPVGIGHDPQISHSTYESHGRGSSHFRFGSHSPFVSHNRWQSHNRSWSHYRDDSHNRSWSHERRGSLHNRYLTHLRHGSPHNRILTHKRYGSPHDRVLTHQRFGSPHDRVLTHKRQGSPHDRNLTHQRYGSPHDRAMTHKRVGTPHDRALTHQRTGSPHNRVLTHQRTGTPHDRAQTHQRLGSPHDRALTHKRQGSPQSDPVPKVHTVAMSKISGSKPHVRLDSHYRLGSKQIDPGAKKEHAVAISKAGGGGIHTPANSHQRGGSKQTVPGSGPGHTIPMSKAGGGLHTPLNSHQRTRSKQNDPGQTKVHAVAISKASTNKGPTTQQKLRPATVHTRAVSHARIGSGMGGPNVWQGGMGGMAGSNVQQQYRGMGGMAGQQQQQSRGMGGLPTRRAGSRQPTGGMTGRSHQRGTSR